MNYFHVFLWCFTLRKARGGGLAREGAEASTFAVWGAGKDKPAKAAGSRWFFSFRIPGTNSFTLRRRGSQRQCGPTEMLALVGRRSLFWLLLMGQVCSCSFAAAAPCDEHSEDAIPGEYLIRFQQATVLHGAAKGASLRAAALPYLRQLRVKQVRQEFHSVPGLMHIAADQIEPAEIVKLKERGLISYVEPNCRRKLRDAPVRRVPNDPLFDRQWGLDSQSTPDADIQAAEAWGTTTGHTQVVVAVVDSGIDYTHQDLAENMWLNPDEIPGNGIDDDGNGYVDDVYGINAVRQNNQVLDDLINWHGTHIAGIIGAVSDNGRGISGVNWNVQLMAIKVFDGQDGGDIATILRGWQYAITMKERGINVRVLNNSFGEHGVAATQAEIDMVSSGNNAGIVFVFAAGNEGANNDIENDSSNIPLPNVLSVAAIDQRGMLASFSNYGAVNVHLAAPGVSILGPVPGNGYEEIDGTSFAAPFVSGASALYLTRNPGAAPSEVKARLLNNIKPLAGLRNRVFSRGEVDAYAAVNTFTPDPVTCSPAQGAIGPRSPEDRDGDGVSDNQEIQDGSDPDDRGSFRAHLQSPVVSLWNSYLDMIPIAELINPGSVPTVANAAVLDLDGAVLSEVQIPLPAFGQRDLILTDLPGVSKDSYGLLKIDFCGGALDGRVSYYGINPNGGYNFAFSVAFAPPLWGGSAVTFNTYPPAAAIGNSDLVANWLTVVNLSQVWTRFVVERFDALGGSLDQRSVELPPLGRRDLEAGHEIPGPNQVGLLRIIPEDSSTPYLANLTRYGYGGRTSAGVYFAYPLPARAGTGRALDLPLTTTLSSQNWLEVVNSSDQSVSVDLSAKRHDGLTIHHESVALWPRRQRHFDVNSWIGPNNLGVAEVRASEPNSLIVQSMVYVPDQNTGNLKLMYGSPGREAFPAALSGSYNLYLGMWNWLKLINPSPEDLTPVLTVHNIFGTQEILPTVPANGSIDIGLHDYRRYGTSPETVGVFEVNANGRNIVAELLRVKPSSSGSLTPDFLFPTEVR